MTKAELKMLFLNNFESFKDDFINADIDIDNLTIEEQDRFRCLQILANHNPMMYIAVGMVARDILGVSDKEINEVLQKAECIDRYTESRRYFIDFFKGSNYLLKKDYDETLKQKNDEIDALNKELSEYAKYDYGVYITGQNTITNAEISKELVANCILKAVQKITEELNKRGFSLLNENNNE